MDGACGTQEREGKGMQDFGGENWRTQTAWKTSAQVEW